MYTVKKEDLIGRLVGFPIEVVQLMIEYQFLHTGKTDITVFQSQQLGLEGRLFGFWWDKTSEGLDFWYKVITKKNFQLFFEKYPREEEPQQDFLEIMRGFRDLRARRLAEIDNNNGY